MSSPSKNVVTIFDASKTVTSITYIKDSLDVTDGEKYTPQVNITQSGSQWTITVGADRKGSEKVANSFNAASGGAPHEYAAVGGGGGKPNELNFYFTVQVNVQTAQGSGSTLLNIGQGHYGTTNNWWLGGIAVISGSLSLDVPIASGTLWLVLPISGTNDSFTFGPGSVSP